MPDGRQRVKSIPVDCWKCATSSGNTRRSCSVAHLRRSRLLRQSLRLPSLRSLRLPLLRQSLRLPSLRRLRLRLLRLSHLRHLRLLTCKPCAPDNIR